MRTVIRSIPFLLVIVATASAAVDRKERFAIKGVGAVPCADFTELTEDSADAYRQFGGWMNGYVSALNEHSERTFDLINFESSDSLFAYVANYCNQNPDHRFLFAVKGVITALQSTRIEEHSGDVVFSASGIGSVRRRTQTVRWMLDELIALGYLPDRAGRTLEPARVHEALRAYQDQTGLTVTGLPDDETLVRLLRKPAIATTP